MLKRFEIEDWRLKSSKAKSQAKLKVFSVVHDFKVKDFCQFCTIDLEMAPLGAEVSRLKNNFESKVFKI